MKKYDYVLVLCILILAYLAVWFIRNTPTAKEEIDIASADTIITSLQEYHALYTKAAIEIEEEEEEPVELMPFFKADDTLESMVERRETLYHALTRNYEKHLIRKYASLNITAEEDLFERIGVLNAIRPWTPEIGQERRELMDFPLVWGRILREGSPNPCGDLTIGLPMTVEEQERGIYMTVIDDRLRTIELALRQERFEKRQNPDYEMPEERRNAAKLTDKQIEFLNHIIVTQKIPAKDPGLPFNRSPRLSDEDRAFIEDAVKGNPAVKLPWRK